MTEKYVFSAETEMEFLLIPSMLDPNVHLSTWAIWIILEAGEFPSCTSCFVRNIVMKKGNTSIAFPRPQNSLKHKKYDICSTKRQNLMEVAFSKTCKNIQFYIFKQEMLKINFNFLLEHSVYNEICTHLLTGIWQRPQ